MVATLVPIEHIAGPYSNQRLFEWCMAVMMLLIATTLAFPGDTIERSALKPLLDAGFTEGFLSGFFAAFGTLRAVALAANGYINNGYARPSGATLRAIGAAAGAIIWGEMMICLLADALQSEAPSLVIPVFGTLVIFEVISCGRARRDSIERRRKRTPQEERIAQLTRTLASK